MSALGHKRTCAMQNGMSALPAKADMCGAIRDVRSGPEADIACLLDHFVGAGEYGRRNREAQCFRGLKVDDQRELCRCLHRQVGWSLAFEDAINVASRSSERIDRIRSIGDQAAFGSEVAERINSGQSMPGCKVDDQFAVGDRRWVR